MWPGAASCPPRARRPRFGPEAATATGSSVAVAFEDDEDLLLRGVSSAARTPSLARVEPFPVEAGEVGAISRRERRGRCPCRPSSSSSTSSMLTMFSGRGAGSPTASGSTPASMSHGSSSRPWTPRPPDPNRARARQPPDLRRVARLEDEKVEAVRSGDEGVLVVVGLVDHAIAPSAPRAPRRPATQARNRRGT